MKHLAPWQLFIHADVTFWHNHKWRLFSRMLLRRWKRYKHVWNSDLCARLGCKCCIAILETGSAKHQFNLQLYLYNSVFLAFNKRERQKGRRKPRKAMSGFFQREVGKEKPVAFTMVQQVPFFLGGWNHCKPTISGWQVAGSQCTLANSKNVIMPRWVCWGAQRSPSFLQFSLPTHAQNQVHFTSKQRPWRHFLVERQTAISITDGRFSKTHLPEILHSPNPGVSVIHNTGVALGSQKAFFWTLLLHAEVPMT